MVKRVFLLAVLLTVCLIAAGCGKDKDKSSDKPLVLEQVNNGYTAQLTISKDPVPVMKETVLTLTLRDAAGQPVQPTSVSFDLTMPGMTMPPNKPEAAKKDNGVYEAPAIFTMEGDWRCLAAVELPDGSSLEFTFDFAAK
jgi:nitrous oxide reductase accessory protein NosL